MVPPGIPANDVTAPGDACSAARCSARRSSRLVETKEVGRVRAEANGWWAKTDIDVKENTSYQEVYAYGFPRTRATITCTRFRFEAFKLPRTLRRRRCSNILGSRVSSVRQALMSPLHHRPISSTSMVAAGAIPRLLSLKTKASFQRRWRTGPPSSCEEDEKDISYFFKARRKTSPIALNISMRHHPER